MPIRFGVLGHPVAHSLSPQMQEAAFAHEKISARYGRFEIPPDELRDALRLMGELGFGGANLTVPHKVAALDLVESTDANARRAGAVNTVIFDNGKSRGFNTDGTGFSRAIAEEFDRGLRDLQVLVLGAGGAARAIAAQCLEDGVSHLAVWNRTAARALEMRAQLLGYYETAPIEIIESTPDALSASVARADLIINATSVGLRSDDPPLISRAAFTNRHFVYDTIYRPSRTRLLEEAAAAGAATANGLSMLLHQGAAAFTLWTSRPAPLDVMRDALRRAASA